MAHPNHSLVKQCVDGPIGNGYQGVDTVYGADPPVSGDRPSRGNNEPARPRGASAPGGSAAVIAGEP